jgi:hypothetical protein
LFVSSGFVGSGGLISFDAREMSPGSSPVVTGIFSVWPFRQTVSSTFCPIFFFKISRCSCVSVVTAAPSTCVMTSNGRKSLL